MSAKAKKRASSLFYRNANAILTGLLYSEAVFAAWSDYHDPGLLNPLLKYGLLAAGAFTTTGYAVFAEDHKEEKRLLLEIENFDKDPHAHIPEMY